MANYANLSEVVSESEILKTVKRLACEIEKDYVDKNLLTVSVLKGSVIFTADLVREINIPLEMAFMAVSSYGAGTNHSGVVNIRYDVDRPVHGKDVLIVEDIIDTGLTLGYLKKYFANKDAASIKICALFDKPSRRKMDITPDYKGIEIEDNFVVGYGLDADNKYRNLRSLCKIEK